MYHNTHLAIFVTNSSYLFLQRTSLRNDLTQKKAEGKASTVKARLVNKNFVIVNNNNNKRNLIPTEYRKVFWALVASQERWDHVFNKFIERVDELNQPIKVKEPTH